MDDAQRSQFLMSYFEETQSEMRWRRDVEYKIIALLLPFSPLSVAALFALATTGNHELTITAAIAFVAFSIILLLYTREKIVAEHKIYAQLGSITVALWERFGFFETSGQNPSALLGPAARNYGQGKGYRLTLKLYTSINIASILIYIGIGAGSHLGLIGKRTPTSNDPVLQMAIESARIHAPEDQAWLLHSVETSEDNNSTTYVLLNTKRNDGFRITLNRHPPSLVRIESMPGGDVDRTPASTATTLSLSEAQALLAREGLYAGRIDGLHGPRTARALRAYQSSRNLPASGVLDPQTIQAMLRPQKNASAAR